jgi:drug/metabolite transporter (DMT)-like permease
MNEDILLTMLMYAMIAIMFVIIYLLPIAGIIVGVVLLKKKPKNNPVALLITIVSSVIFTGIIVWKVFDIIEFQ